MKKKPTAEDFMKEISKLKSECEALMTVNQALTDELDMIYNEDMNPDALDLFNMMNEEPSRGILQ